MTKKKKIVLFILLCLTLLVAGWGYSIWSENRETQKAIAWVEEQGGFIDYYFPQWIYTSPKFTQGILNEIAEKDLVVNLEHTDVSDINLLKNLTQLKVLDLSHSKVSDINILKNLTNLRALYLQNTKISDISALRNLTNLRYIDLSDTEISEEQIKELQLKNPKLEIIQ